MGYQILVSSYTSSVTTLSFDPTVSPPALKIVSSVDTGLNPSWITFYPNDHSLVFAALEQLEGKIVALKYDEEGNAKVVGRADSGGGEPCSLLATKEHLFVANYASGRVSTIPISPLPPYLLSSTPTSTVQLEGTGPNKDRQQESHPHQVVLHQHVHEDGHTTEELLVPDLGADLVQRFSLNTDGSLTKVARIDYNPGDGPRHVVIHDDHLFTLHELSNTVSKHTFPRPLRPGFSTPSPVQLTSQSTLSTPPSPSHPRFAAEILVPASSPAFPIPYVYISNRDDPHAGGETIAIFEAGTMRMVGEVRTGLNHLRGMVFGGPDDRWLAAGGVKGGGVKIFERIDGGKSLKEVAKCDVEAPTGFLWKPESA